MSDTAVHMAAIDKRFGGIHALRHVSFTARFGEITALLGENGAGKSTILKILRGVEAPDSGTITLRGQSFDRLTPQSARALGVGMIFQELSLVPTLTVAQNMFLGHEPCNALGLIDETAMERGAETIFASIGVSIDPQAEVDALSTGQQQLVEIAKVLNQDAEILVLDEPTSALSGQEVDVLFDLLGRLRASGKAIIYVSHRMDEIFRITDRATVLRNGSLVASRPISEYTLPSLIADMIGRQTQGLAAPPGPSAATKEVVLSLRGVTSTARPNPVTFDLHRGKVLGLAGLMGSGRSRIARLLFGLEPAVAGEIILHGQPVRISTPSEAIAAGLALIPEDRRRQGLVLAHSIEANVALPMLGSLGRGPFVQAAKLRALAARIITRLAIKAGGGEVAANTLSGGNQQKIVIGKWLETRPEILILDEPTAGIDIGAKSEVLGIVRDLAAAGKSVIFISSELAELIAVSDRIAVVSRGEIVKTLKTSQLTLGDGHDGSLRAEEALQLIIQGGMSHD